jgi:hypothetical protein
MRLEHSGSMDRWIERLLAVVEVRLNVKEAEANVLRDVLGSGDAVARLDGRCKFESVAQ